MTERLRNMGLLGRLAACVMAAAAFLAAGQASAAELLGVRFGASDKNTTRVVFDLSGGTDYTLSADETGAGGLIVDLPDVTAAGATGKGGGHVSSFAVSAQGSGARAVLTFGRTAKLKGKPFLLPPKDGVSHHRLVIDLTTADKAAFLASLPAAPPPQPQQQYATEKLDDVLEAVTAPTEAGLTDDGWPIVVIDAGHGGTDPGARGPTGILEKTVTLAAAKQLADILEAKGRYRIVMTRAGDSRLGLEDRSKAARDARASLFISLHADAHANEKLRGGSVYTLSDAGGERSAREAQAGDYHVYGADLKEKSPEVANILFDFAQGYTRNKSSIFAEKLLASLDGVTPLINNSHRTADLFVLLSPDVPAVLFELAFISNKNDEGNLNSPAWREKTMTAVAAAIDAYFEAEPMQHAANAQKPSP